MAVDAPNTPQSDLRSLGSVAQQAYFLIQELERVTDEEFSREACVIKEVLICCAEHVVAELKKIGAASGDQEWQLHNESLVSLRIRILGSFLQELYSSLGYLLTSSPRQTPPGLQSALNQLTELFLSSAGKPICVVRPDWRYELTCLPLSQRMRGAIHASVLDPEGKEGPLGDIISSRWRMRRARLRDADVMGNEPPGTFAILSFPGLNTNNTLYYPLLAHELAHVIDSSVIGRFNEMVISKEAVHSVLEAHGGTTSLAEIHELTVSLHKEALNCINELLADLVGARMIGLSLFLSQAEFLNSFGRRSGTISNGFPPPTLRLWLILKHLLKNHPQNPLTFFQTHQTTQPDAGRLIILLQECSRALETDNDQPPLGDDLAHSEPRREFNNLVQQVVLASLDSISKTAQSLIPDDKCATLSARVFDRILLLRKDLPPSCPTEDNHSFSEILSAAWAYHLLRGSDFAWGSQESFNDHEKTNRLILKAIELIPISQTISNAVQNHVRDDLYDDRERIRRSGVLSRHDISRRLNLAIDHEACLAVVPLDIKAVKAASLKVHLGNWFSYARRTKVSSVRISDLQQQRPLTSIGRDEVFIPHNKDFLLHPNDLVLGVTQEFFGFPNDVMAFVEGLSTLGRLGLFVATATQVAPGFHGVLILELVNAGTIPLQLSPGMEIAQLVFQTLTEPVPHSSSENQCPIKP